MKRKIEVCEICGEVEDNKKIKKFSEYLQTPVCEKCAKNKGLVILHHRITNLEITFDKIARVYADSLYILERGELTNV